MTVLSNTFETGLANGTTMTIANSDDGTAGTAFDYVGGHPTYSTTATWTTQTRSLRSAQSATTTTNSTEGYGWNVDSGNGSAAVTAIAKFGVPLGTSEHQALITGYDVGGYALWRVVCDGDGRVVVYGRGNTILDSANFTITKGTRAKVEVIASIHATSLASNSITVKVYSSPTATTPNDTLSSTGTDIGAPGTVIHHVLYGQTRPAGTANDLYVDEVSLEWTGGGGGGPATITATNKTANGSATNATSYTTASVTPTAGRLLCIDVDACALGVDPPNPTITGNGLTWTLVTDHYWRNPSGTSNRFHMWRYAAFTGGSPSAGTILIDFGAQSMESCEWNVYEIDQAYLSGTVAEAFVQHAFSAANTSGTSGSASLAAFAATNDGVVTGIAHLANETTTVGTGHTKLGTDGNHSGPNVGHMVQFRADNDTSADASWATSAFYGVMASEIRATGGVVNPPDGTFTAVATPPYCGGGYQSMSVDPVHPGYLYAGSDVGGIRRSVDAGVTWTMFNKGLYNPEAKRKVAGISCHANAAGTATHIMAAFGQNGNVGTAYSDDGDDWTNQGANVNFYMHNGSAITGKPRTLGQNLAFDVTNGVQYAASYNDGIYRSSNFGTSWTMIGGAGRYPRCMYLDPTDPSKLYIGYHAEGSNQGGLYRIDNPNSGTGKTLNRISTGSFNIRNVEDIAFAGSNIYVAAAPTGTAGANPGTKSGDSGIFRTDGSSTWEDIGNGAVTSGTEWPLSIGAVNEGGSHVVICGIADPRLISGSRYNSVRRSINAQAAAGTVSWNFQAALANVTDTDNPGNDPFNNQRLGRQNSTPCQIVPDPHTSGASTRDWYLQVAEGGIFYYSSDGGQNWTQRTTGMTIWSNNSFSLDPTRPGFGIGGNQDNDSWYTPDNAVTVVTRISPSGASNVTTGHDQDVDPFGKYWCTDGDAGANNGYLASGTPSGTSLSMSQVWSGNRLLACKTGLNGGNLRIVVYRDAQGFYYTDTASGASGWTAATTGPTLAISDSLANTPNMPLIWPDRENSGSLYAFLRGSNATWSGVLESTDRGENWSKIRTDTSATQEREGYVTSFVPGVLYFSNGAGEVYRGVKSGGSWSFTQLTNVSNASAITMDTDGNLLIYCIPTSSSYPKLLRCMNPASSGQLTFEDLADPVDGLAANDLVQQMLQCNSVTATPSRVWLVINGGSMMRLDG